MLLEQPPCDTSLLGVARGAMAALGARAANGQSASLHETFALSGHAFVINIHEALCPSGPYCWNFRRAWRLLANVGLAVTELGTAAPANTGLAERRRLEAAVREAMAGGSVCAVLGLDHQLIRGQDDAGFALAQPWGDAVRSTPPRLTFGTWAEFLAGPPITFYKVAARAPAAGGRAALEAALGFALETWRQPRAHTERGYGMGDAAYRNWLEALDAGRADPHGVWWNAVVWGECRERAADYFQHIAADPMSGPVDANAARRLAKDYRTLARLLYRASDKTASNAAKRGFVAEARQVDGECAARLEAICRQ